ncbi:MAG: hypothetical protein CR986_00230 [Ignavibacteriae bacterium]|nr:MAG: hypothetical protein CR986_00230 [Ignavibacteriota bacterium]
MIGYVNKQNTTDERFYFVKDHLGNIKVRVDEDGGINGRSGNIGNNERFKFNGKERDAETGLDYFGARYYDSKIGR